MEKAAFRIKNYQFDKVTIDLSNTQEEEISNIEFDCSGEYSPEQSEYRIIFSVKVFGGNHNSNSFINIRCNGLYEFQKVDSIEEIPSFFYQNAIAILFPYMRAYISIITTQANIPGIILPTLNLSGLAEELKRNTNVKK